jgi:hypothetical protein
MNRITPVILVPGGEATRSQTQEAAWAQARVRQRQMQKLFVCAQPHNHPLLSQLLSCSGVRFS